MIKRPPSGPHRSPDRAARRVLARVVQPDAPAGVDPVVLGRVLLLAAAALSVAAVPMLDTGRDSWQQATLVSGALSAAFAASFAVPWDRLGRRALLVFPALVCGALMILGTSHAGVYAPLTGLISLGFAYVGLTQPPRTALAMLPLAAVTFVLVSGALTVAVTIRLFVGGWVWVVLGEVLSRFTSRQDALSSALRVAAHTDALTGLANRRDLELHLAVAAPGDTIVICDIDRFKRLNDTLGHHAGDQVLAEFGSMLRATVRGRDYCARFGGEEFVLVLPGTDVPAAEATLDRMRAHWAVLQPDITFSAGLAGCHADRSHAETLAAADRALYLAKAAGRNCNVVDPAPDPLESAQA